jgi:catechol-2,3-dioxygenase
VRAAQDRPERAPALLDGVAELTLETRAIAPLERFYVDVLGCEVLAREDDRVWLACGPRTRLGLWTPGPKEFGDQGGRHVHFAFASSPGRLDALVSRIEGAGVALRGPVEHPGGDRSIYVEDPAGNVVEVWDFFAHRQGAREGVDALGAT